MLALVILVIGVALGNMIKNVWPDAVRPIAVIGFGIPAELLIAVVGYGLIILIVPPLAARFFVGVAAIEAVSFVMIGLVGLLFGLIASLPKDQP